MNFFKTIVYSCVSAVVLTSNIFADPGSAGDYRTYVQVSPETFTNNDNYAGIPYINFTAQVYNNSGTTMPFYRKWSPSDGFGARSYHIICIHNTSRTQSVSFIAVAVEDNNPMNADSRVWVGNIDKYENITWHKSLDDDHGPAAGFGTKITLAPNQTITLIVSPYSPVYEQVSQKPWFMVDLFSMDAAGTLLETGYPEAIVDANGTVTVLRGNPAQ
jgi:hypothetical protein